MSEIKVNSIKGAGASTAAITVHNTDGTATGKFTNLPGKNLVVNGSIQVGQRMDSSNTGGLNLAGVKTADRFSLNFTGTDNPPTQHHVDVAAGTTPYTLGFRKKYQITNGNQTSGAGAADYMIIRTKLEAQDIAKSGWNYVSASSYVTLSFWVKSSVAQNFYGRLETPDGTAQNYPFETGSLSANTWTKITKTIPGNSNITINNDNGTGIEVEIMMFRGTDQTGSVSLNTWAAYASGTRSPDQTSTWWTTDDATFEITGVQLEVGDTATDFEHISYGDELRRCKRYYHRRTGHMMMAPYKVMDSPDMGRKFSIFFDEMRAAPTVTGITHTTNGSTTVSVDNAYVDHIEFESGDVGDDTYVRIDTYQADSEL